MTHAPSPATSTPRGVRGLRPGGPRGLRRGPSPAAVWLPLLLGVLYGLWACAIERDAGPITAGNVLFGVFSGLTVAVLAFLMHQVSPRLPGEARAAAWGALSGAAFGYMYSLTGASVIRTVVIAILTGVGITATTFYHYHTSEH